MTPQRLNRIRAVYEAAVDTPDSAREALLGRECKGDEELRQEVERLLGAREHLPDWLSGPVLGMAHAALANGPSTLTQPGLAARMHFAPGTVLAHRYRIIYLLGRGGMGEVYRADDLVLGQPVALKFLPAASEAALSRFRTEVCIARQVSHPNVCRVYDIGEADGLTYFTMEYVDGEDLASLLRRIGKLPQDKALEIARQLCAALAAAHDKGVIHRDLKPANIMLDGRGQVRITDFGIAGMAAQIRDVRSGTPDYMSPEQLAGKEVTPRSDIYALGIVLCELLTGKRPPLQAGGPGTAALDPPVERVIRRCLDPDPGLRPPSALTVSAALPGGDPLAAALARGETPSPDVVAASQQQEGLTLRRAAACFAVVLLLLAPLAMFLHRASLLHYAPVEIPAEALAFRAAEVLNELGYNDKPGTTAFGFDRQDWSYIHYLDKHRATDRARLLASHRPAVISFWYRQSPQALRADSFPTNDNGYLGDVIDYDSPPNTKPDMVRLRLDAKGRLVALEARPSRTGGRSFRSMNDPFRPGDWSPIFRLAELDPARFSPAEPVMVPPTPFDMRAAWTGTFGQGRTEQVRLEAASWAGRPVYFMITGDWQKEAVVAARPSGLSLELSLAILFILLILASVVLAWRNLRRDRADRRGALMIAITAFSLTLSGGLLAGAHVAGLWEMHILVKILSWSAFVAGLISSLYLAVEPNVRRYWPNALISWSRFRAGQLRDPLVASHLLIGIFTVLVWEVFFWAIFAAGGRVIGGWEPLPAAFAPLNSSRHFAAVLCSQVTLGIFLSLAILVFVAVLRVWIRRVWLADLLASVLVSSYVFVASSNTLQSIIAGILNIAFVYIVLWMLRRFGLMAAMAVIITDQILSWAPPLGVFSWYGGRSLLTLAIPASVAAWAFWVVESAQRRQRAATP